MSQPIQPPSSLAKAVKLKLGMILVLALLLRLMLPIASWVMNHNLKLFWSPDTTTYVEPAKNMIDSARFLDASGKPEFNRPPGYPLLLTPGIVLDHLESVTIGLQIILSCATVLLVFLISNIVFESAESALFAALLYAMEPLSIIYSSLLLTETLFTFLLTLTVYLILSWVRSGMSHYMVLGALTIAASAYVRPVSYYLPLFLTMTLAVLVILKRLSLRPLQIVSFLLVSMATMLLWEGRNYIQAGYRGFSATQDSNLYEAQAMVVLASKNGISYAEQLQLCWENTARHTEKYKLTRVEELRWMRTEGLKIIRQHPLTLLKQQFRGMFAILMAPGVYNWWKLLFPDSSVKPAGLVRSLSGAFPFLGIMKPIEKQTPESVQTLTGVRSNRPQVKGVEIFSVAIECLAMLSFVVVYAMAFVAILNARQGGLHFIVLLVAIIGYFVVLTSVQGESRYRHPIMPFISILAGYGLTLFKQKLQERFLRMKGNR